MLTILAVLVWLLLIGFAAVYIPTLMLNWSRALRLSDTQHRAVKVVSLMVAALLVGAALFGSAVIIEQTR